MRSALVGAAFGGVVGCFMLLIAIGGPAHADDRFLGRWSIDPSGCKVRGSTAETTPLVVTDSSVAWFPGYCTIKKSYLIGEGLYLQAQCLSDGNTRVLPIGLQLKGKKLMVTWDQTKAGEMQRCR
jgi:hypothetical protein